MKPFLERLRSRQPLLLDGGLGSMLIARGLRPGSAPEAWVLERPEEVLDVHRCYVGAGSEAIHACTFGANAIRLAACGLAGRGAEINRRAVELARSAGPRYVIADIGPTGESLPPVGGADPEVWPRVFAEQATVLAEAGVDAFHVETMSDRREALTALWALRQAAPGVPVMVSMTFERRPRGFFTVAGDPLTATLLEMKESGADAVGANCSITSLDMADLAAEVAAVLDGPLVFQPSAGPPTVDGTSIRYDQAPESFADDMRRLADTGISTVGGCCGTDPRFIRALRARLDGPGSDPR